jgi:transcription antitermination factor NusG
MVTLARPVENVGGACTYLDDPWYALKVRTRSEKTAIEALTNRGFETFSPICQERRRYSDRIKIVESVVFPGYVFCRFAPHERTDVLASQAVDYIVSVAGKMAPIPDSEIEQLRRAIAHGAQPAEYKVGQRVRVEYGAFAGQEGELIRCTQGSDELLVSISLLQRSVSLQINREQVRSLQ